MGDAFPSSFAVVMFGGWWTLRVDIVGIKHIEERYWFCYGKHSKNSYGSKWIALSHPKIHNS